MDIACSTLYATMCRLAKGCAWFCYSLKSRIALRIESSYVTGLQHPSGEWESLSTVCNVHSVDGLTTDNLFSFRLATLRTLSRSK